MLKKQFIFSYRRAFTLLEVLAALAIASVLVVALVGLFSSTILTEALMEKERDAFEEARLLTDAISAEVRKADMVLSISTILLPETFEYLPFLLIRNEKKTTQVIAYAVEDGNIYRLSYRTNQFRNLAVIHSWDSNRSNLIATDIKIGDQMYYDASTGLIHISWKISESILNTAVLCEGARP